MQVFDSPSIDGMVQDTMLEKKYPGISDAIALRTRTFKSPSRALKLSELFAGEELEPMRRSIAAHGYYTSPNNGKTTYVKTRPSEDGKDHEILAIASVSRDPGKTQDYMDLVADFATKTSSNRANTIKQYWEIYGTEGIVNNAVNKYASVLSVGGEFLVRYAKKGKVQKATQQAQTILDFFNRNVNGPTLDGVATAARGLKAVTEQGIRVGLIEGDWIGRQVWGQHQVGTEGVFQLPMTIQTLSMEFMSPIPGLQGIGELWYWTPPADLKNLITGDAKPDDKETRDVLKKLFDNDLARQVKKNGKALLTAALLSHVKHRGSDRSPYGESYIEPAKLGIRYLRTVTNTDMVSLESVVNRLMVVMVGSSDPQSPYAKPDVAAARAAVMQTFFDDPGPNMTIVWQGDDVKVESVGAMKDVLQLAEAHQTGTAMVKVALGMPEALLMGNSSDGQSAGWASLIAASGMAEHMGGAFSTEWTIMGERILTANGFTDIDVVYQYDRSNLADKEQDRAQTLQFYLAGVCSIRTALKSLGVDPDAEFIQRCMEKGLEPNDESVTWEQVFTAPQGLPGQGTGGAPPGQGPGKDPTKGRPSDTTKTSPSKPPKKPTAAERRAARKQSLDDAVGVPRVAGAV